MYQFDNYQLTPEVKMSSSISSFYTKIEEIVEINKDFNCQKQEVKRSKLNFGLYEKNDEEFRRLCQQNNTQGIAIYFMNIILDDHLEKKQWELQNRVQMALQHLQYFFEAIAYEVTKDILRNWEFNKLETMRKGLGYARIFIYNLEKIKPVIAKYNPAMRTLLRTYISQVLKNEIKDKLGFKLSKWRRLMKTTEKDLEIALLRCGYGKFLISQIKFVLFEFFKKSYRMNRIINNPTRKSGDIWPEAELLDYEESVKYYNSDRMLPYAPYEVSSSPDITIETLKEWIEICNKALYSYINIETNLGNVGYQDDNIQDAEIDNFKNEDNIHIQEEIQTDNSQSEINPLKLDLSLVLAQFRALDTTKQKTLIYYYGFNMKSKNIGAIFSVGVTAILHRLKNIKKQFMDILMKTLYEPNTREEWAKIFIDNWLDNNYQKPVYSNYFHYLLMKAIKTLDVQEQHLLQKKFGQKTEDCQIAREFGILEEDLLTVINQIKAKLEQAFLKKLEEIIQCDLPAILFTLSKNLIDRACLHLGFSKIEIAYLDLRISARDWSDMENVDVVLEECLKILNSPQ